MLINNNASNQKSFNVKIMLTNNNLAIKNYFDCSQVAMNGKNLDWKFRKKFDGIKCRGRMHLQFEIISTIDASCNDVITVRNEFYCIKSSWKDVFTISNKIRWCKNVVKRMYLEFEMVSMIIDTLWNEFITAQNKFDIIKVSWKNVFTIWNDFNLQFEMTSIYNLKRFGLNHNIWFCATIMLILRKC